MTLKWEITYLPPPPLKLYLAPGPLSTACKIWTQDKHRYSYRKYHTSYSTYGDMAQGQVQGGGDGAAAGGQGQQPQAQQRSWGDILRSIIFQMVIFYFISSYFRGNKTPPPETKGPDGKPLPSAGINLFSKGQELVSKINPPSL